ncbi:MAG TPA: polyprenyl synthetase family protein, partial [Myxococcaceae bacterium]
MNRVNHMETTPETARFLEAAEARLSSVLSRGSGEVGQSDTLVNAGRHLCIESGGKRVRPMMVHLFGLAAGAPDAGLLNVAVAAELVHSA